MKNELITLVAAYFSGNPLRISEIPEVFQVISQELKKLQDDPPVAVPAVLVSDSIHDDYLVCLEDGKHLQMLKRYLRETFNMSPADYRQKWGLPEDYPMVAPAYARRRSEIAKEQGLGKTAA